MPYQGEFASYKPLGRLLNNPNVRDVLDRCQRRPFPASEEGPPLARAACGPSGFLPDLVLAIDGSYHQIPVSNGFPSAELACLTAAAVLIDLKKQRQLDAQRPVDPKDFRQTQGTTAIDCALPGANVILDEPTPEASFRRQFSEATGKVSIFDGGETLLDTYEHLLKLKPTAKEQDCPYGAACEGGQGGDPRGLVPAAGRSTCPCVAGRPLFSTDALRMHEGFNPTGSSGAMFAEAMQVWERLWIINFLRSLEARGLLAKHAPLAVLLDGPLAVFGHPAWLSQAIHAELLRLNAVARGSTGGGRDLLILGIEKTGAFVDHFDALDAPGPDGKERIPRQAAYLLSGEYIRRNIVISEGKTYGQDTYFGRKVFYKTKVGSRLVVTLPFVTPEDRDLSDVSEARFPRLADAMSLLDAVFSVRYPNAVGPIVMAHAEAAIPMGAGRAAFDRLVEHLRGHRKP